MSRRARTVPRHAGAVDDDVESVERDLTRALGAWTAASALVGAASALVGQRSGCPALRAFGVQTLLWAGVDAVVLGVGAAARARAGGPPPAERLRRLLVVNTVADVGYVAVGSALAVRPDRAPRRRGRGRRTSEAELRAHGLAVVVQGLALLVLDARAAARLPAGAR